MSSLKDLASLIMVPSLVKDGRLDTVKPLGNSIIHPDATGNNDGTDASTPAEGNFTFSRGSNLAATRVDVNGLIEKGRENLFTQSNNFSHSDWNVKAGTFTQGVADPNGGNNAWSWTATNTDPYLYQSPKTTNGVSVLSIWVKGVGSTIGTSFQIRTGAAPYNNLTLTGEWQRVEHFNTNASGTSVGFEYGNPAVAGDVVHIYQAQYEQGLVATDYIETGASTAQAGILEDLPRLDYSGGASCPALLLEPQRTNLVTQSEYFNVPPWSEYYFGGGSLTRTFGYESPEGNNNAYKFDVVVGTGGVLLTQNITINPANAQTLSVWMKGENGGEKVRLALRNSGSAGASGGIMTLTSEWARYDVTLTTDAANRGFQFRMLSSNGVVDQTIYVWGAQLEEGSYPTSYIPTYGSAVTRSGEATLTSANTFDSLSSFTWFFEISRLGFSSDSAGSALSLRDSSGAEQIRCHFDSPSEQIRFRDALNGYATMRSISVSADTTYKMCLVCDGVTTKLFLDGIQSGGEYTIVSQFDVDRIYMNGSGFICNQLLLFPTALTDSECIALTTL
jgi:hypothetical protein